MYYYAKNKTKFGPITKDEIVALINNSEIVHSTLIWTEGLLEWKQAVEFDDFKTYFKLPPPLPTISPPPIPKENNFNLDEVKDKIVHFFSTNKNYVIALLGIALLILIFNNFNNSDSGNGAREYASLDDVELSIQETEITGISDPERGQIIVEALNFIILAQPTDGRVKLEIENNSAEYAFEFNMVYLELIKNDCRWWCSSTANQEIRETRIGPGETKKLYVPVSSQYTVENPHLLMDANFTTILRQG